MLRHVNLVEVGQINAGEFLLHVMSYAIPKFPIEQDNMYKRDKTSCVLYVLFGIKN